MTDHSDIDHWKSFPRNPNGEYFLKTLPKMIHRLSRMDHKRQNSNVVLPFFPLGYYRNEQAQHQDRHNLRKSYPWNSYSRVMML